MENSKNKKFNSKDEKGINYEIEMELTHDSIKFKTEINNGNITKKYSNIFSFDKLKENIVFTIHDNIEEIYEQLEIYIDDTPVSCEINENNIIIKIITKIKKSPEIILELNQEKVDKKEIIEILLEKIKLIEEKNNNLESKLSTLESNNSASLSNNNINTNNEFKSLLNDLQSKITNLESKNKELDNKNKELESKISNLFSKNNNIETTITNMKSKNKEIESKITNIGTNNKGGDLDKKLTNIESNITSLESKITNIETKNTTNIDTKISTIESTINTFESKLSTLESKKNNNIESKINTIETKITNIESKITNIPQPNDNSSSSSIKKEIDQIKSDLNTINSFIKEQKEIQLERKKHLNFGDSLIVKEPEINMICDWIKPNAKMKTKLLYRVSRDGDGADKFHKYCDNKGPIIIFAILYNGYRFGGYSGLSWTSKDKWVKDKDSFLFSLNNKLKFMNNNTNATIYHGQKYGPYFGGGMFSNELVFNFKSNKCLSGNNNTCNDLGGVYTFKNKGLLGIDVKGNYHFDIDDYEVYSITM